MITARYQSWNSILQHYNSLLDNKLGVQPMIDLVKHISTSYSDRLFGCISLDKLIVSIYEEIDWRAEALHIKFEQGTKQFHFSYYGGHTETKQPEWRRIYEADLGVEKFDQFVKMINW